MDDGSTDRGLEELNKIADQDMDYVSWIEVPRNSGLTAAIAVGTDHSFGDLIVLIGAGLETIPLISI